MKWKFQREEHNRQDKVKKPDYREDFLAKSPYDAMPLHPFKSKLIRRYEQGAYFFKDKHLRLHWSWKHYAQVNKLEMTPVNHSFHTQSSVKEEDFGWQEVITKLVTDKIDRFSTTSAGLNIRQQSLRDQLKRVFLASYPNYAKRLPEAIYQRICGEVDAFLQAQIKLEDMVNRQYKPQKAAAVQDFQAIRDAIRNAETVWGSSRKGQQQPQVFFTVRLQCDCVIPYKINDDEIEAKSLHKSVPSRH